MAHFAFGPGVRTACLLLTTTLAFIPSAHGQDAQATALAGGLGGAFTSDNAILDTSLPFAIGAQEAQQSLRGSFGWATFQEGLVEGVYFRFDPDGYARFSPSPRLDTDVFEVICRPRTYTCIARKGGMQIMLTSRGQTQIKMDAVVEGDQVFVTDGLSEIQMPERILMPLDVQMETLLAVGGDILLRRNGDEVDRVSLTGFGAVAAYLRWIAARQDYTVLPRGWPVPNAQKAQTAGGITQAANWQSPMPQPQQIPQTDLAGAPRNTGQQIAGMQSELTELRRMLGGTRLDMMDAPAEPALPGPATGMQSKDDRIAALEAMTAELHAQIAALGGTAQMPNTEHTPTAPQAAEEPADHTNMLMDQSELTHLKYLVEDMGLDLQTAINLLQLKGGMDGGIQTTAADTAPHEDLVKDILNDLSSELTPQPAPATPQEVPEIAQDTEYKLLTEYFQSVMAQSSE